MTASPSSAALTVVDHPLVRHKLSIMRARHTPTAEFRRLLREIAVLLGYEATRDLSVTEYPLETPVAQTTGVRVAAPVFVPVLRAGLGLLDGMLDLLPEADVAHIGLYRDPETLKAVEYYFRAPADVAARRCIVVDPMLATGRSAVAALDRLKGRGAADLRFVCLLAAPEGLQRLRAAHPDVPIWTAAVDERLNEHSYIVPGLGDAGDRLFGTQ
ncbi:uracil phosphoribosyltransferase [Brevundimonas viscosa]|nr:uracil phosphoribosyltransferase [Brevundimonas viscosa]